MLAKTRGSVGTGNKQESAIAAAEIARNRPQAVIAWIREDGSRVV
jgi:hypothetical protein